MIPKIKIKCNECGERIRHHTSGDYENLVVEIDPCVFCLKFANAQGYARGSTEALEEEKLAWVEGKLS